MEPFGRLEAVALPIARANVDTDQLLPARYIQKPRSNNFGHYLFKDLRADASFVLNQPALKDARIVVAARNFGCGSSREHAVWALYDYGFRAAIAPSFGDIFHSNALKNGFLPIVLREDEVMRLIATLLAAPGTRLAVDLAAQTVTGPGGVQRFEIDPFPKRCLLEGLDELGYTLSQAGRIADFERNYEKAS